jgi:uncharacterized protein (TIGR02246 family)
VVASEVNRPDVVAEVQAVFDSYEAALAANDLGALDELLWDSPEVVRFGVADRQHGRAEIAAFRRAAANPPPPRTLQNTVVTTFGTDVAVVTTEFRSVGDSRIGRQSQTWIRVDGRWRVVSAHVSIV